MSVETEHGSIGFTVCLLVCDLDIVPPFYPPSPIWKWEYLLCATVSWEYVTCFLQDFTNKTILSLQGDFGFAFE